MKINKYIISTSIMVSIIIGNILITNAENNKSMIDLSNSKVRTSLENILDNKGIEYVKLTYSNGEYLDMYRDTLNGKEQIDYYDEFGNLMTRHITNDFGKTMIIIGNDGTVEEPNYQATRNIIPKDLAKENESLLKKSYIKSFMTEDTFSVYNTEWKQVRSNDSNLLKFSNKNGNIYIDSSSGDLVKKEIISEGEISQTIEVDKLNFNSEKAKNLFKIDSPFTSKKARNNLNLKNINMTDINLEEDEDYSYSKNAIG